MSTSAEPIYVSKGGDGGGGAAGLDADEYHRVNQEAKYLKSTKKVT